jgi:hypothetical protein
MPAASGVRFHPVSGLHSGVLPAAFRKHSVYFRRQYQRGGQARILILMKASPRVIAAFAMTLPTHVLLIVSVAVATLFLLIYLGIALPAVWSARPARRKAAATVLGQILKALTGGHRR